MFRTMTGLIGTILILFLLVPAGFAQSALSNCKYYTKTQQDFVQGLGNDRRVIGNDPVKGHVMAFPAGLCADPLAAFILGHRTGGGNGDNAQPDMARCRSLVFPGSHNISFQSDP